MIEPLLDLVREQIVAPQADVVDTLYRAELDPDNAPTDVTLNALQVEALTTTPINPEIGSGIGGMEGGMVIGLRHVIAVALTARDATRAAALVVRGGIVADLMRRVYLFDWANADIGDDQSIDTVTLAVEYAELETQQLAAYATVVLTIDTEWRL